MHEHQYEQISQPLTQAAEVELLKDRVDGAATFTACFNLLQPGRRLSY